MKKLLFAFLAFGLLSARAGDTDSTKLLMEELRKIDSIEAKLHYKTGKITLNNGLATLNIAPGFKFLDSADARYLLEDVWGNLKGQTALGMIVPADERATIGSYAFIVEYEPLGYVKDEDANDINYDDMLKQMKEESVKENEERRKEGVSAMSLIGWAAKPYYNKERKLLYWAKELKVEGSDENTLNYDIRLLGRKGVMVLRAVSGMSQLDSVNKNIGNILGMVAFNQGHRYQDFDSKIDNVAAWTIGGLVAGKLLAKVGILALVLKNIKLVLLAIAGFGGTVWRFITGKKKKAAEEDYTQTVDESTEGLQA